MLSISKVNRTQADDDVVYDYFEEKILKMINYPINKWDYILPKLANGFLYELAKKDKIIFKKSNINLYRLTSIFTSIQYTYLYTIYLLT